MRVGGDIRKASLVALSCDDYTRDMLEKAGIKTVDQLIGWLSRASRPKIPYCGRVRREIFKTKLEGYGIKLDTVA